MIMRRLFAFLTTLVILATALVGYSSAIEIGDIVETEIIDLDNPDRIPGEVILVFKEGVPKERRKAAMFDVCARAYGTESVQALSRYVDSGNSSFQLVTVPDNKVLSTIAYSRRNSDILFAEPNYRVYPTTDNNETHDDLGLPQYSYDPADGLSSLGQWHLDRIKAKEAWDAGFTGSNTTIVAVIDTGYSYQADLDAHIDHTLAYNALDETHSNYSDVHTQGHGTFTAGIIGALINGSGTNGICPNVKIVPIRVSNASDGGASTCTIANAIDYATGIGADVANVNYSHCFVSTGVCSVSEAVNRFGNLVVMAAGNNNCEITPTSEHASGLANNEPLWFIVGASTYNNTKRSTSNYSSQWVDIFAPGQTIISSALPNTPNPSHGTSYAAPMVTAAVALIKSHATHLTPLQIKNYLMDNVTSVNGFNQLCVAGGVLNIYGAVNAIYNENRGAYSRGDIDGNGIIDSVDYLYAKRVALGTYTATPEQIDILDINRDGAVTSVDYLMIQRYYFRTYYFPPR